MKSDAKLLPVALALVFGTASAALAADFPKEGKYDYTACWSGVNNLINFSKTQTAFSYEMTGTTRSNPPGGIFDMNTFRCVGTNASLDGKNSGITVCEATDRDGDKRLAYFSAASDGTITRLEVAGTGKYDGMVLTGSKVTAVGPFPNIKAGTFQSCNHQTGNYKLK